MIQKMIYQRITQVITIALTAVLIVFSTPASVIAYQAAPVAISKQPTFVTEKSARLNGQGNPNEMPDTYQWFEWGISGRTDLIYETPHQFVGGWGSMNILVDLSTDIVGLAPGTQYFYRQIVENGRGKDIGQMVYFTTKALSPEVPPLVIVQTESPSALGELTVTLRGYVSPHGNNQTKAWFQWGASQRLESQTPVMGISGSSGPVESALNNLTPGTMYFYRIVAENTAGRTYGAIRAFNTTGTPPPHGEEPVTQQAVLQPVRTSDGVTRVTTTSGSAQAGGPSSAPSSFTLPGITGSNRPGDFSALFKKQSASGAASPAEGGQVAGVAQSGNFLTSFFSNLTGNHPDSAVTVEKVGSQNPNVHTMVEYRISYVYHGQKSGTNAKLKITIPSEVVYISDNTNNELVPAIGALGERTYILPIGQLADGATRTISVVGMTTSAAKGFPDVHAQLEYDDVNNAHLVLAATGAAVTPQAKSATVASGKSPLLPGSLFGWMLYVLLIVLVIIGIRKGREYYQKRKEVIEAQEGENDRMRLARMVPGMGGKTRIV